MMVRTIEDKLAILKREMQHLLVRDKTGFIGRDQNEKFVRC